MTQQQPVLTIGIPTYNRRDTVARRVDELLAGDLEAITEILVIDNDSPDGTAEFLQERFRGDALRVLSNSENIGFAGNFLRLIDEAKTPHIMFDSDEDTISHASLRSLAAFCERERPLFVSPRARVGTNDLYRGRARTRPIEPSEFRSAAFYLSGLTFDVAFVREHLEQVRSQIPANSALSVYPQVALAAHSVAEGRSWFLNEVVTSQAEMLPSAISDPSGIHYGTVAGRWANFLGYEEFFAHSIANAAAPQAEKLALMRDTQRAGLPRLLLGAARSEVPGLRPFVDRLLDRPSLFGRLARGMRRSR